MLPPLTDEETESASPFTVLVIDDDELSLRIIANALYETQYQVLTAANAADGIRLAKEDQPNLIIAKAGLSGIDAPPDTDAPSDTDTAPGTGAPPSTHSTKLIALLKQCAPEASVIAMTDYGAEQLAAFALKEGAEDYLIHPVYPWEIVSAAGEVLERAELRRRNLLLAEALRLRKAELEQRNQELEDANARLHEADIWKENLSNMIIHDLKNPLGVIQGTMIYFKGTLEDYLDDRQTQLLDSALISSDRALRLVNAILDVHRLEEGRMPLELKPVAVDQVIQVCLDEVYPLLTIHALTATMHLPEALPSVCADYNTLVRIIGNLLDNAIKFTPSGGRITISARGVPDGIHFSVSDTGYGIPAEQRERIFEKFAQAGIRLEGKRAGVGLGLTFCKLAVEAHHGRIWAESAEGSGATFHFVLPIWVGEA